MHTFGRHTGSQGRKCRVLAGKRNGIDVGLRRVGNFVNPERPVKSKFKAVKISHAAKTQKHRLAAPHNPGRGAVMGFRYGVTRRHNLQKMRIWRHVGVVVMRL